MMARAFALQSDLVQAGLNISAEVERFPGTQRPLPNDLSLKIANVNGVSTFSSFTESEDSLALNELKSLIC
jgi:hypothetical protein